MTPHAADSPGDRGEAPRAVLAGIARLFREALDCQTEEQLGGVCLAVAEELTQSRFGFIGEINQRTEQLDVVAISDAGRDACRMELGDKEPMAFTIHGIYGRVLLDERGLYTNDPAAHPDSVGTPEGHPPLAAFLGVPLSHAGRVIGMLGLANREGGYGPDELEAVEALAPAIVQVFVGKRGELALRENEARLRRIIDTANEGIWIVDPCGVTTYVNARMAQMLGHAPDEMVGRNAVDFVWPDDTPAGEAEWEAREGDTSGPEAEHRYLHRDGTAVTCLVKSSAIVDEQGRTTGILGMVSDITDRRQAEEELARSRELLQSIFDSIPVLLVIWDPQLERFTLNRHAEAVLGWSTEEVNEGDLMRLVYPDAAYRAEVAAYMQSLEPGFREWLCTTRDGRQVPTEWANVRLTDDTMIGIGVDLTRRKELERERERYLARIEEANEAKDLFFNTLSHELRTPLAAMLSSVEVLGSSRASEDQRARALHLLGRNVRRQTRLIDDLLDLSRIMRGKIALRREPLDLREVVAAQAEAAEASAREGRIALSAELPEQPVVVLADDVRLGQVVSNLLDNAVKFTEPRGRVTVAVCREADQAVVRVEDTGIGIAPELIPRLFDPFQQADTSLTRRRGGLGIGLGVARSLAELHGGTLVASSEGPGRGSQFVLRLPLCAEQSASARLGAAESEAVAGRRILVVDDGADVRLSLTMLLELMGHEVLAAADGAGALELARQEPLDVALIDIGLPDMDGYEVARRIRDGGARKLRLVALSGYTGPEHQQRALRAGFDHHVAKPVDTDRLRQVIGTDD